MRTTQSTASHSSMAKPDNPMSDVRLEPCSNDVTSSAQSQEQRTLVTNVQITPSKAPADMTDAIRRQSRTCGIGYWKGNSTLNTARPLFRAVLSGSLQSKQMQCIINTRRDLNGNQKESVNGNTRNSNNNPEITYNVCDIGVSNSRNLTNGVSGSKSNNGHPFVSKIVTENSGEGGYSVVYNKPSNGAVSLTDGYNNGQSPRGQAEIKTNNDNKSAQRNPKLSLTHRPKAHSISDYPESLTRLPTPDPLAVKGKDETLIEQKKYPEGSKGSSPRESRTNSLSRSLKRSQTMAESNSQASNEEVSLSTLSRTADTKVTALSTSSNSETSRKLTRVPKSKSLDGKGSVQKQTSVQGLSCLQFADSILGAVNNDLNQIYQLCQSKVRYSEFIEKTHPHRLGDKNGCLKDGLHHQSHISNLGSPKSSTSTVSPHLKKLATLPDLPFKPRQLFKPKPSLDATPTQPTSLKRQQVSEDESEIDYDKPITIVIETDERHSKTWNTRPILKSKAKSECSDSSEVHNNKSNNDNNNNLVPHYLSSDPCTNTARELTSSGDANYSSYRCAVKDKGRLVRFSSDHKIHEFAPSEPVTQTS